MKCVLCTISLARLLACVGTVSGTLIAVALIADEWYTKADWWVAIFTFGLFVATLGLWIFTALLWQATKQALVDGQKSVETANAAVVVANRHADASASGAQAMGCRARYERATKHYSEPA